MLGQFVTDHPLLGVQDSLAAQTTHEIGDLETLGDGDLVTIGGIIGAVQRKYTKRGEPYAQFRLEGLAGGSQVMAFPSIYEAVPGLIEADRIVLVSGRIDLRGRELQIRANEMREPDLGLAAPTPAAATPRGRSAGRGVHARRPRQGEGAAGGPSGERAGAGAVPLVERRDAARGRELPRRPDGRAAGRAPRRCSASAPRASATTLARRHARVTGGR